MNKKEFLSSFLSEKGSTIRRTTVLIGKIENEFNLHPRWSRSIVDDFLSKQVALGRIERYSRGVYKIK